MAIPAQRGLGGARCRAELPSLCQGLGLRRCAGQCGHFRGQVRLAPRLRPPQPRVDRRRVDVGRSSWEDSAYPEDD